jgi:hypothetical protein
VSLLDELILWLATHMGNLSWVNTQAWQISKLIEAANPDLMPQPRRRGAGRRVRVGSGH